MADLERLGIPIFPATIVGDRFVHGWNPKALAELVGIQYAESQRLTPEELWRRLDRVLAANQRAVRAVPAAHLATKAPDRDRTLRELAFHVFRLSAAFADCREQGQFPEAWLLEDPPPAMQDGPAIAAYGQRVRDRLAAFCARPGWCDGQVTTYYGEPGPLWRVGYQPGLDIGAPIGTTIRAIADGIVIEADWTGENRGYGYYVKIDHGGGLHSLYGHMSVVSAREGDRVSAGSVLGLSVYSTLP